MTTCSIHTEFPESGLGGKGKKMGKPETDPKVTCVCGGNVSLEYNEDVDSEAEVSFTGLCDDCGMRAELTLSATDQSHQRRRGGARHRLSTR